jgi:hypothetical protein
MNGTFANLSDIFSKRFEPDGDDYLFRARISAPGIPVSAGERDGFVAVYQRASRWALWGIVGLAMAVAMIQYVALAMSDRQRAGEITLYVVLGLGTAVYVAVNQWLYNAPVRALRGRAPTSPGRTKVDAQRIRFQRMTWSYITGMAVLVVVAWLRLAPKHNLFVGWNKLWLVGLGVYALLLARVAFYKWKSGQTDRVNV